MTPADLEARLLAAGHRVTVAGLVDEAVAATALGIHLRTLRRRRLDGTAPPHALINTRAWYAVADLAVALSPVEGQPRTKGDE